VVSSPGDALSPLLSRQTQRQIGRFLGLSGLLLIAGATLVPLSRLGAAAQTTPLWCLVCGNYGGVDVVLNVLLFVPFALGFRLLGMPLLLVVAAGAVISLTVEWLQFSFIAGRNANLSDLTTNTLGSFIGGALGSRLSQLINPTPDQAHRLALVGGVAFLALQAGTAILLRPWVPSEPLRGVWARTLPGRAPFGGTLTSAVVSGSAVPDGFMLADSQVYARLRQGSTHLELDLVSGPDLPEWAPIFELLGRHGRVLAVAAVGRDLTFQPPTRSYALRLRRPAIRLPGALPANAGQRLQLAAGERQDTVWGAWRMAERQSRKLQTLSPSLGWSLLVPFDYAYGPEVHLLTALWIGGLLLPIAYWQGRRRTPRPVLALGLLLLAGLGLIPMLAGYPAVHWSEWLAGVIGLGAGWASHRAAAYFGGRCDSPSIKESC
jgi:hypothetical protein